MNKIYSIIVKKSLFSLILALAGSTLACALPNWAAVVPDSAPPSPRPIEIDQSEINGTDAAVSLDEESAELVLMAPTASPDFIQSFEQPPEFLVEVPEREEILSATSRNWFRLALGLEYRVFPSARSIFNFKLNQGGLEGGIIRLTPVVPGIEVSFTDFLTDISPEVARYDRTDSIIFILEGLSSEIEVNINISDQTVEPFTIALLPLESYLTIPIQEQDLFLESGTVDRFDLPIEAEQLVVVEAVPDSDFDVVLELYDAEGIRLSVDEESEGGAERLELSGLVPQQYTLVLIGFQASEGNYDLQVKVFDWDEK